MSKQPTTKLPIPRQPKPTPGKTNLSTPQENLAAMLSYHPALMFKLIEALETDRFFITLSFQKKKSAADRHDLQHFWHRQQYPVNDVLPSLRHLANDYKAKECPEAEIEGNEWH